MKKSKKLLSLLLIASCLSACTKTVQPESEIIPDDPEPVVTEEVSEAGVTDLRIMAPDVAFRDRLEAHWDKVDKDATESKDNQGHDTILTDGSHIVWKIPSSGPYADKYDQDLTAALTTDRPEDAAERIDMYIVDSDHVRSYLSDDYSMDLRDGLGIGDDEMLDRFYGYTQLGTDSGEVLRALSWDADPGVFLYKRSVAKDVLGDDYQSKIIDSMLDLDTMKELAQKSAEAGYRFISAWDDTYPMYEASMDYSWQDGSEVRVDPMMMQWVMDNKEYCDNGWNHMTTRGSQKWAADLMDEDSVFGVFTYTSEIHNLMPSILGADSEEQKSKSSELSFMGDFAVCSPPYKYEGTVQMLLTCPDTDNTELAASLYSDFVCDPDVLRSITEDPKFGEFTNTMSGMYAMADVEDDFEFFGGDNPYATYEAIMENTFAGARSPIDRICRKAFLESMEGYIKGKASLDSARSLFEGKIKDELPDVTGITWP